jgi:hypothetical protein
MALTPYQRRVCRLLAERRRRAGDSYIAGGVALSVALETARLSRDVDVFHDTAEAVEASWTADRELLLANGHTVTLVRERTGFVQAMVARDGETTRLDWVRDSAYRFFPLVEHDELGLTLHPFDLATNKVLALVGRVEVRDWVDVLACHERLQPLGYLAWAACGKDPGYSPLGLLEHAARTARYSAEEVAALVYEGDPPDAGTLSRQWRRALESAAPIVRALPADHVGTAVLDRSGTLFTGTGASLEGALASSRVVFHAGRIGGAIPQVGS